MARPGQVTELAFERTPDSEACHVLLWSKRLQDYKTFEKLPGTQTFPVYLTPAKL